MAVARAAVRAPVYSSSMLDVHHKRPVQCPNLKAGGMTEAESPTHDALEVTELACLAKDGESRREVSGATKPVVSLRSAEHHEQPGSSLEGDRETAGVQDERRAGLGTDVELLERPAQLDDEPVEPMVGVNTNGAERRGETGHFPAALFGT